MRICKLGADRIYCGEGAIAALADLPGLLRRAYIVMSGDTQVKLGQLDRLTEVLDQAGWTWRVNIEVEPEPCWKSVQRGVQEMRAFEPDWVIGFGGGSAMDAAKAMWVFYENPSFVSLEDAMPPAKLALRQRARMCCIATTAGTGSECTRAALIKDPVSRRKYSVREYTGRLIPDVAILDPEFSLTMPRAGTVACGMDALTHCIEAYVARSADAFSDAQAIGGWITGYRALQTCAVEPSNLTARQDMLIASCLGGIAFTNGGLGICHGVAHTFGAAYNVAHGLANAVALPYSIAFNRARSEKAAARYGELARLVGATDLEQVVLDMQARLDVPPTMRAVLGGGEDAFEADFDQLTDAVMEDVCTPSNPVRITREDARFLLEQVFYGGKEG
ncbi:iron-containing alcohol dehydrogenase [Coriobacterium glomerans PW2]|uniref:Iron-containing alcohol dehydrogenase n=1 Tax=Coriobacterium glomerans (strain ATCC 49209 / DSM 20642 / JCM 10262 / PW2) TaxID=700015 RepID=F2N8J0_CORGP|nr:iron-containing alcohol dehydrogenase [Coriobacterium glomerans]AEB07373.1 iron-containing alcohol dehydrogenase [Coriobacterium glomerans PW2]